MKARDIMSKELVWVRGEDTALEASETMRTRGTSSALVERRDPDDAWGIVTLSDIVRSVVEPGHDPRKVRVHEIMSKPIVLIGPDLGVHFCALLMKRTDIRRLPVYDGKELVGIVTHKDIVRALLQR